MLVFGLYNKIYMSIHTVPELPEIISSKLFYILHNIDNFL